MKVQISTMIEDNFTRLQNEVERSLEILVRIKNAFIVVSGLELWEYVAQAVPLALTKR